MYYSANIVTRLDISMKCKIFAVDDVKGTK